MAVVLLFTLLAGPVGVITYMFFKAIANVVGGKPIKKNDGVVSSCRGVLHAGSQ